MISKQDPESKKKDLIFVLDPNDDDIRLITLKLEKRGFRIMSFKSSADVIRTLHTQSDVKLILIEYNLNESRTGIDIIQHINNHIANPPPILMISSEGDETVAVDAIKSGAMDYMPKVRGWYNQLHLKIIHCIIHKDMIDEVKELRELTDAVFENSFDSIAIIDKNGNIIHCNHNLCELVETPREELIEKISLQKLFGMEAFTNQLISDLSQGRVITDKKSIVLTKFGLDVPVLFSATLMQNVDRLMFIFKDIRIREELLRQINELKQVASEKITISAFKVGGLGPEFLSIDTPTQYLDDELLMKMAIYFSVSLGQGDSIHKGLFGPLPMPVSENPSAIPFPEKYVSVIWSLNLNDKLNTDARAKGKSFTLISINMPDALVDVFHKRKNIEEIMENVFKEFNIHEVDQINPPLLKRIKNDVINMNLELD